MATSETLSTDQLFDLNDNLTQTLSDLGWQSQTEEEDDALNDLTHEVGELIASFLSTQNMRRELRGRNETEESHNDD